MFIYIPSSISIQMFLYSLPGIYEKDTKDENVQKDGLLIVEDIRDGL